MTSPSLVNYWPFNSHIQDVIGGAHLFEGYNAALTEDRFGRPLSALNLSIGYYKIPPGNYFQTGTFTITAWLKLRQHKRWARLIDFSNGWASIDAIFLNTYDPNSITSQFYLCNSTSKQIGRADSSLIPLNTWTHISMTYNSTSTILKIYLNGTQNGISQTTQALMNIERLFNYIGRSSNFHGGDPHLDGVVDELKIFNKELSQKEIEFEMNN